MAEEQKPIAVGTHTQSKTKTNLAVAVLALAAAGGIAAFAFIPSFKKMDTSAQMNNMPIPMKCGVNSFGVMSKCKDGYMQAKYECYDGTEGVVGNAKSCHTANELSDMASAACADRCNQPMPGPELASLMVEMDQENKASKWLLAGRSEYVGTINLQATERGVQVNSFALVPSSSLPFADVDISICVEEIERCGVMDGHNQAVVFEDVDFDVIDDAQLTLSLDLPAIGDDPDAEQLLGSGYDFAVWMEQVEAEDLHTNEALAAPNFNEQVDPGEIAYQGVGDPGSFDEVREDSTRDFRGFSRVVGARIANVELVDSFGGFTVNERFVGPVRYTLAILRIDTDGHNNVDPDVGLALQVATRNFVLDIEPGSPTTSVSDVLVERIGGVNDAVAMAADRWAPTQYRSNNLLVNGLGDDARIEAGETAYFMFTAQIEDDPQAFDVIPVHVQTYLSRWSDELFIPSEPMSYDVEPLEVEPTLMQEQ